MCNNLEFIIDDDDYQMCCKCYLYYDEHNPKVIDNFENGIEDEDIDLDFCCINCNDVNVELNGEQYICTSCGCCNGYKFDDYKKIKYYKKMFYNRKYHLEKYIKKYENYKNFDRIKVITLFHKIVNRLLDFNLKRKRIYKFDLILKKVFKILDYNIEINIKESKSFNEVTCDLFDL
jgi:hypothetical protein